ncbi:DUF1836 domain-containing protein [Levilactobacillus bambusae]|uniref:DUF1836 domain-containing protein n=1 Tax=Levilactobacillus bambusae TaxID=2024736 RepID=A0A2V1MZF8_9LACO|nr:DUF1836 domain-containing protein [Levilactobacillus bambusae]PWG00202.1 hypothetical protein DCM90_04515 [Levilactobacillus bambusae]
MPQDLLQQTALLEPLRRLHLPLWAELPTIPLHQEQVIGLINETLAPLPVEPLTAAMVANYIKKGFITKPVRKRYEKLQIGELFVIGLMKNTFTLAAIGRAFEAEMDDVRVSEAYDRFIELFNSQFERLTVPVNLSITIEPTDSAAYQVQKMSVQSSLFRITTHVLLMNIKEEQQDGEQV